MPSNEHCQALQLQPQAPPAGMALGQLWFPEWVYLPSPEEI